MKERFSKMEDEQVGRKNLEERLNRHPVLKARIEGLLAIVEDAGGDLEKANAAEERVIEELRQMGNEILHGWAQNQEQKKSKELEESERQVRHKEKKTSIGTLDSER
jgi:hypothetical protein